MSTTIGDLVLVRYKDDPAFFARIEDISADHKPGWYHVRMLVLQDPVSEVTWILRQEYISGKPFTMGGHDMTIVKIVAPKIEEDQPGPEPDQREEPGKASGKVVSLLDRKR